MKTYRNGGRKFGSVPGSASRPAADCEKSIRRDRSQPGAVNGQRLLGGIAYTTSTARDENSPSLLSFEA